MKKFHITITDNLTGEVTIVEQEIEETEIIEEN